MFTCSQGKGSSAPGRSPALREIHFTWMEGTKLRAAPGRGSANKSPCSERANPHPRPLSEWSRRLLRSLWSCPQKASAPPKHSCAGREVGGSREGAGRGAKGRGGARRRRGGHPGSRARGHPAGPGPGDGGAGLTHEEAEEVQADEQRPLAAALARAVAERRAAPVLAVRRDRLVVLVVLHGAGGCRPATAATHTVPRRGPLRAAAACGRGPRGGRRRGTRGRKRFGAASRPPRPAARPARLCAPSSLKPQRVRKSEGEGAKPPAETWAEGCPSARATGRAARTPGRRPPRRVP